MAKGLDPKVSGRKSQTLTAKKRVNSRKKYLQERDISDYDCFNDYTGAPGT